MKLYRVAVLCLSVLLSFAALSAQNTSSPYYHKFSNLHKNNWGPGYALLSPSWSICKTCSSTASGVNWSRNRSIASPSLSGSATKHSIGGTRAYSDILWNDHLVGSFSTQNLPDTKHTLTNGAHNFIYEAYFYTSQLSSSQERNAHRIEVTGADDSGHDDPFLSGRRIRLAVDADPDRVSLAIQRKVCGDVVPAVFQAGAASEVVPWRV